MMRLGEIATKLSCDLSGEPDIEILGVATLENAQAGDLSFLANNKYYAEAKSTKASAVIVGLDCPSLHTSLLRHENPYLIFAKAVELFYKPAPKLPYIHPTAWISDQAILGKQVSIGAFAFIDKDVVLEDSVEVNAHCSVLEGARIGGGTILHAGSVVREKVSIGRRCIIHSNAVVGSDGFGYAKERHGSWYKIYQSGTVIIEDDVEIGAGSTIDRATIGETVIGKGTKIDNLVQVGHGCNIGEHNLICAQVGLAGSTKIGNGVILAGQVGVAGHLTIGDGAIATAQTGIGHSVEPGKVISGSPSIDNKKWLKSTALFARLPEIQRAVRELEKRIATLEETGKVKPEELINTI